MRTSLPHACESASRTETTSRFGSYGASFVVGVLGFVVGNLALDAIKERIHPNAAQSSSQSVAISPPPLATQAEPGPPALPPQEPISGRNVQDRQQNPAATTTSLPAACALLGPIVSPNSTAEDTPAYTPKLDPNEAIAGRLNPKLAESYDSRGITFEQKGYYDMAIADFNEAIRLNPALPQAYYNRGVAALHKGGYDRAIADFNAAIRLDPKLAAAYYGRGFAYSYCGQRAKAEMDFAQAKRLGYTSPTPSPTNIFQFSLSAR